MSPTRQPAPPALSVLGVALDPAADAPTQAALRALQTAAPPGIRLDVLDVRALQAGLLGDVVADRDAVLLLAGGTPGTAAGLDLNALCGMPVAVVDDGRFGDAAGKALRRRLAEAGARVMPPLAEGSLLEALRRWAQAVGRVSLLTELRRADSSP